LGLEGADYIEMGSGTQIAAIEERSGIGSAGAKHIGFGRTGVRIGSGNREPWHFL